MKNGKAVGPAGIVAEMLKASPKEGIQIITDLANVIIRKKAPSSIATREKVMYFQERDNNRGLNLLDQVMNQVNE